MLLNTQCFKNKFPFFKKDNYFTCFGNSHFLLNYQLWGNCHAYISQFLWWLNITHFLLPVLERCDENSSANLWVPFFLISGQLWWSVLMQWKNKDFEDYHLYCFFFFPVISQCWPKSAGFIHKILTDSMSFIQNLSMLPMSIDFSYLEPILTICNLL